MFTAKLLLLVGVGMRRVGFFIIISCVHRVIIVILHLKLYTCVLFICLFGLNVDFKIYLKIYMGFIHLTCFPG